MTVTCHDVSLSHHQHVTPYDRCSTPARHTTLAAFSGVASLVEWTGDACASSYVMTAANIDTIQRSAVQCRPESRYYDNALIAYQGTCPP